MSSCLGTGHPRKTPDHPAQVRRVSELRLPIDGLTRSLSNELAPRKIRVNAIKPGVVDTEGVQAGGFLHADFGPTIISQTPLRRLGVPDDITPASVYLASDESSWTTGEYFILAGGHR